MGGEVGGQVGRGGEEGRGDILRVDPVLPDERPEQFLCGRPYFVAGVSAKINRAADSAHRHFRSPAIHSVSEQGFRT